MKLLRLFFPSANGNSRPAIDSFDVYRRRALNFSADHARPNLNVWSPADAEGSVDGAARLASGMLRNSARLRRRFPAAISEGEDGPYCEWLRTSAAMKLGLSRRAVENISTAFRSDPGKRVLEQNRPSSDDQLPGRALWERAGELALPKTEACAVVDENASPVCAPQQGQQNERAGYGNPALPLNLPGGITCSSGRRTAST